MSFSTLLLLLLLLLRVRAGAGGAGSSGNGNGARRGGADDLVLETTTGRIRGVRQRADNGRDVDVWWGIPFAEPPVGELRFKAPRPVRR